jgi:hypothetical protein
MATNSTANVRLIAIEVGDLLKYVTTVNEIDRYGAALFRFECDTFPNESITSVRAKRIHDWILTLARQEMLPDNRSNLLRTFCHKLAREVPDLCQKIDKIVAEAGITVPGVPSTANTQHQANEFQASATQQRAEFRQRLDSLLHKFDDLTSSSERQGRGYFLQDLLNEALSLHGIHVVESFTRNDGAEQIDGAFKLEGWHYLVECRWRGKLANIRELDGLRGQLERSGKQAMGLFLSINGWSENVIPLLKQNSQKSIILMEGSDLRSALTGAVSLPELVLAKAAKLTVKGEPFYRAADLLREQSESP